MNTINIHLYKFYNNEKALWGGEKKHDLLAESIYFNYLFSTGNVDIEMNVKFDESMNSKNSQFKKMDCDSALKNVFYQGCSILVK